MENDYQPRDVFHVRLDSSGRVVLPAESKVRQASCGGDTLIAVEQDDGSLTIRRLDDVLDEIQRLFKSKIPPGVSLVDELIAERREEAARE